jgi:hypothetical protein
VCRPRAWCERLEPRQLLSVAAAPAADRPVDPGASSDLLVPQVALPTVPWDDPTLPVLDPNDLATHDDFVQQAKQGHIGLLFIGDVVQGVAKVVDTIREKLPTTKILLMGILPMGEFADNPIVNASGGSIPPWRPSTTGVIPSASSTSAATSSTSTTTSPARSSRMASIPPPTATRSGPTRCNPRSTHCGTDSQRLKLLPTQGL